MMKSTTAGCYSCIGAFLAWVLPWILLFSIPVHLVAQEGDPEEPSAPPAQEAEDRSPLAEARELVRQGQYPEAAAILGELHEARLDDAGFLAFYGEVLVASGNTKEAVPVLERALLVDPQRPRLHFQMGTALSELGDLDEALNSFSCEIEVNEDPEVRFLSRINSSILLKRQRLWVDAARELEDALRLQPDHPDAYGDLASIYLSAGNAPDAAGALERGEPLGFRSAHLYFNVGARFYNDHGYPEAEKLFRKALEIRPEMAEAERSLGSTLFHLGRAEEARRHLDRYLELKPDAPDAQEIREQVDALPGS